MVQKLRIAAVVGALLFSSNALGLTVPTESEWATWPDFCRARFVVSGDGRSTHFVSRISRDTVKSFETTIGKEAWYWLHHHCAGLLYLDRAINETNERQKRYLFKTAEEQILGQYRRVQPTNAFFPEVAIALGRLYRQTGEIDKALSYLQEAIVAHRLSTGAYALAAFIHRDLREYDKARDLLLQINQATGGRSAEIQYFLGLVYLDIGDLDSAVLHASEAYKLNYPLPGLRDKLRRLGRTLN